MEEILFYVLRVCMPYLKQHTKMTEVFKICKSKSLPSVLWVISLSYIMNEFYALPFLVRSSVLNESN